ncbi:hypothetical protein TWF730_002279 [Orbilia blumenaviensis]|uniref:GRF-type domain-containing protein n=1 Tax=Orbilia blumenaviensis TaxID=1796055 RepID=A0AAV9U9K3_9PEZI
MGKNEGRQYWACSKFSGARPGCNFWIWIEEAREREYKALLVNGQMPTKTATPSRPLRQIKISESFHRSKAGEASSAKKSSLSAPTEKIKPPPVRVTDENSKPLKGGAHIDTISIPSDIEEAGEGNIDVNTAIDLDADGDIELYEDAVGVQQQDSNLSAHANGILDPALRPNTFDDQNPSGAPEDEPPAEGPRKIARTKNNTSPSKHLLAAAAPNMSIQHFSFQSTASTVVDPPYTSAQERSMREEEFDRVEPVPYPTYPDLQHLIDSDKGKAPIQVHQGYESRATGPSFISSKFPSWDVNNPMGPHIGAFPQGSDLGSRPNGVGTETRPNGVNTIRPSNGTHAKALPSGGAPLSNNPHAAAMSNGSYPGKPMNRQNTTTARAHSYAGPSNNGSLYNKSYTSVPSNASYETAPPPNGSQTFSRPAPLVENSVPNGAPSTPQKYARMPPTSTRTHSDEILDVTDELFMVLENAGVLPLLNPISVEQIKEVLKKSARKQGGYLKARDIARNERDQLRAQIKSQNSTENRRSPTPSPVPPVSSPIPGTPSIPQGSQSFVPASQLSAPSTPCPVRNSSQTTKSTEAAKLKVEKAELEKKLLEANRRVNMHDNLLIELQEEKDDLNKKIMKLTGELGDLKEQMMSGCSNKCEGVKKLSGENKELEKRVRQLEAAEKENMALKKDMDNIQKELNILTNGLEVPES